VKESVEGAPTGTGTPCPRCPTPHNASHPQNEIVYFSLDAISVVDTSAILSHYVDSSMRTATHNPTSSRYKAPPSTTDNTFIYANAVDSRHSGSHWLLLASTRRFASFQFVLTSSQITLDVPYAPCLLSRFPSSLAFQSPL
jgi:hypothetical protein